jgi:hypothetical protein
MTRSSDAREATVQRVERPAFQQHLRQQVSSHRSNPLERWLNEGCEQPWNGIQEISVVKRHEKAKRKHGNK